MHLSAHLASDQEVMHVHSQKCTRKGIRRQGIASRHRNPYKRAYALSSYALTYVAPNEAPPFFGREGMGSTVPGSRYKPWRRDRLRGSRRKADRRGRRQKGNNSSRSSSSSSSSSGIGMRACTRSLHEAADSLGSTTCLTLLV